LSFGVLEPFVSVKGRDGLFRGGDEILFVFVGDDLVEFFVELAELAVLAMTSLFIMKGG